MTYRQRLADMPADHFETAVATAKATAGGMACAGGDRKSEFKIEHASLKDYAIGNAQLGTEFACMVGFKLARLGRASAAGRKKARAERS